jgi:DNA polymerase-3 subunit delta'
MAFTATAAIEHLRRAYQHGRLAHAYLITGPIGSGKREVAASLAGTINQVDRESIFSSEARDVFLAEPESKSRRIVIEQVRELEHALQMRASDGRR